MPAAVLIFIVLGSLAVDSALAYPGARETPTHAAAVASDAATEAIDVVRYYATGELVIVQARAQAVADAAAAREAGSHLEGLRIDAEVVGPDRVLVHVRARVRSLFAHVLPNGLDARDVAASAEATAERG
jgi:hypothetical protein